MPVYPSSIPSNDPGIQYLGSWVAWYQDGSWTGVAYNTRTVGSQAIVQFTGSRIAIIMNIPAGDNVEAVEGDVRIDNGAYTRVRYITREQLVFERVFWDSGPLSFGRHTLEVQNAANYKNFRIVRFDYDPTDLYDPLRGQTTSTTRTSSSSSSSSSSTLPPTTQSLVPTISTTTSNGTTLVVSGTQTSTSIVVLGPTDSATQAISTDGVGAQAPTGTPGTDLSQAAGAGTRLDSRDVVIMGVLGSLVPLLLIALLILWIRHRRLKRKKSGMEEPLVTVFQPDAMGAEHPPSFAASTGNGSVNDRPRYPTEKRAMPWVEPNPEPFPLAPLRGTGAPSGSGHRPHPSMSSNGDTPSWYTTSAAPS